MLAKPRADLLAGTVAYENAPLVKATGFREYDARWLLGSEINLLGVQALGLGLGAYIQECGERRIVVGHDFRSYSQPAIRNKKQKRSINTQMGVMANSLVSKGAAILWFLRGKPPIP